LLRPAPSLSSPPLLTELELLPGLLPLSSGGSAVRSGGGSRRRPVISRCSTSLACLPVVWSVFLDLCGRIWRVLGPLFFSSLVLWSDQKGMMGGSAPLNKAVASMCPGVLHLLALLPASSPTNRGGEGRRCGGGELGCG
jgi:hypothetical protein